MIYIELINISKFDAILHLIRYTSSSSSASS